MNSISGEPEKRFTKDPCIDTDMGNVPKDSLNKTLKVKSPAEVFGVTKDKSLRKIPDYLTNIKTKQNNGTVHYKPKFLGQQVSCIPNTKPETNITFHDSDSFLNVIHRDMLDYGEDDGNDIPTSMIGANRSLPVEDMNPLNQARGLHYIFQRTRDNTGIAKQARENFVKSVVEHKPFKGYPEDGKTSRQLRPYTI